MAVYNGEILTGDAAHQIAGIYPAAFEPTPKRRLAEEAIVLGDKICDPVDLVAAVLQFIVSQAERYAGGGSPTQVVLTHPEAWDEYLKGRLSAAAVRAGIVEERIVLMPEPVAAAWHYAASSDVEAGAHVAVLDFGGGTCDAAVLELSETAEGPAFHVVASSGIDPLGGHDFDAQLENWVLTQVAAEGKKELLESLKSERSGSDRAVLRDQIREAKHALSFHGSAPVGVHCGEQEWVCMVTREEFEQLIDPQLNRAVELVRSVIQEALPSVEQLHRVYLTGGSSHIPALQSKLSEILPMKLGLMGDPKQVTSVGAMEAPASTAGKSDGGGNVPISVVEASQTARQPGEKGRRQRAKTFSVASFVHDKSSPTDNLRRSGVRRKILIGGGVAASGAVLAAALMLTPGGAQQPTTRGTSSPSGGSSAETTRECGGKEQPGLTEGECNLLTKVNDLGFVNPGSCSSNRNLTGASSGLICDPPPDSNFSSTERPAIYVYGYPSLQPLNTAFDGLVKRFKAVQGSATKPPGWETWHLSGDKAQTVRGRVLGASEEGTNYLVWTEEEPLMAIWAISKDADIPKLYSWWHK
ncbi:actin-like ATPase involved in cell morphogenesis [Pseudarthrobacter defluvii]|uniref:Actin-like ATPase involved in cell morphogenesis n=1 Tax=Pseudarthrobacter defluvii TaxID=410837 RepID=A0ABT9UDW6_9MICC|nr:Hsp70 family protein [Pseudarthrobacter defluvii]MDQ0116875.1 actin-like ATPase involved in cell morphogenesis [Pseudarthrobacter defluvii]